MDCENGEDVAEAPMRGRHRERFPRLDVKDLSGMSRGRYAITVCVLMTLALLFFLTTFLTTADNNKALLHNLIDHIIFMPNNTVTKK